MFRTLGRSTALTALVALATPALAAPQLYEAGWSWEYAAVGGVNSVGMMIAGPDGELIIGQYGNTADSLVSLSADGEFSEFKSNWGYTFCGDRADDGTLYIAGVLPARIRRITPDGSVTTVTSEIGAIAVGPDNALYVAGYVNRTHGDIARIDPVTNQVVSVVSTGRVIAREGMAIDDDGNFYVLARQSRGSLYDLVRYSPQGAMTTLATSVGTAFGGLVRDSRGRVWWASNTSGAADDRVMRWTEGVGVEDMGQAQVGRGMTVGEDDTVYVYARYEGQIVAFSPDGERRSHKATLGEPSDIELSDDGDLYIAGGTGKLITRVDLETGDAVVHSEPGTFIKGLAWGTTGLHALEHDWRTPEVNAVSQVDADGSLWPVWEGGVTGNDSLEADRDGNIIALPASGPNAGVLFEVSPDGEATPRLAVPPPAGQTAQNCVRTQAMGFDSNNRAWVVDVGCDRALWREKADAHLLPLYERMERTPFYYSVRQIAFDADDNMYMRVWPSTIYKRSPEGRISLFANNLPSATQGMDIDLETGDIYLAVGGDAIRLVSPGNDPDTDGDGVPDSVDNCPDVVNPLQEDGPDGDGIGDVCDVDDDDDGREDLDDNCPSEPNSDQSDEDFDGVGDACDSEYSPNSVADALVTTANLSVDLLAATLAPGGPGLSAKLTSEGGVLQHVADALFELESGNFAGFEHEMDLAEVRLDAYDQHLAARSGQGRNALSDDESSELMLQSAAMRAMLQSLRDNA